MFSVIYTEISNNSAGTNGGGVFTSRARATFQKITVSGNSASTGGGIYHSGYAIDDDVLELINVTLSNNSATVAANVGNFNDLFATGLWGRIRFSNTLVANPQGGNSCAGGVELVSTGYNLDTDGSCGFSQTGDLSAANPQLGPLADNGGNTKTHALSSSSDAIDAGDPNVCLNTPNLDQRYFYRNDSRCDIGAYEYGSVRAQSGEIAFTQGGTQVDEGAGIATVTVSRVGGSEGPVSVNIYSTILGTASGRTGSYGPADFQHIEETLEWSDGDSADKTVEITLYDDTNVEGTEELWLKLRHLQGGATFGQNVDHVVTLLDDEAQPGVLSFSSSSVSVDEDAGTVVLTVLRTQGDFSDVSVDYSSVDGTAISGSDYTAVSGTLTFLDGETSKTITVNVLDDFDVESMESFRVVLSNPSGGVVLGNSSDIRVDIIDGATGAPETELDLDLAKRSGCLACHAVDNKVVGPAWRDVANRYIGDPDARSYLINQVKNGSSGNWTAVTGGIPMPPYFPRVSETDIAKLVNGILSLGISSGSNPGVISLSSAVYSVSESNGTLAFKVVRTGGTDGEVTAILDLVDGSADYLSDYAQFVGVSTRSATVRFMDGVSEVNAEVTILDDAVVEGDETFNLQLRSPQGGATLGGTSTATVTIRDDDAMQGGSNSGSFSFAGAMQRVGEGDGFIVIEVVRTGGSSGEASVEYATVDGDARAGSDYSGTSGTLVFSDGVMSQTIRVAVIDDSVSEGDETFSVELSNPVGALLSNGNTTSTVTITDNETAPTLNPGVISIEMARYTVDESLGDTDGFLFKLVRTGGTDGEVSVNLELVNGTAVYQSDYGSFATVSGESSRRVIAAFEDGESEFIVSVAIVNDSLAEPSETFTVRLYSPQGGASLGDVDSAVITIKDDDGFVASEEADSSGSGGGGSVHPLALLFAVFYWLATVSRKRKVAVC